MTRAEKVAEAQRLRAEGLVLREIAERMGAKIQTVGAWLADPDLSKQRARRESYQGCCIDCGTPTDGSNGRTKAAKRCERCHHAQQAASARWTRATITEAIHVWANAYGKPPSATDWNPALARVKCRDGAERNARFYDSPHGIWPAATTVQNVFGSWNEAIRAAGFEPTRRNYYGRRGEDPDFRARCCELYLSGLSMPQVAQALDATAKQVEYALQTAGVPRRSYREARRLRREQEALAA